MSNEVKSANKNKNTGLFTYKY